MYNHLLFFGFIYFYIIFYLFQWFNSSLIGATTIPHQHWKIKIHSIRFIESSIVSSKLMIIPSIRTRTHRLHLCWNASSETFLLSQLWYVFFVSVPYSVFHIDIQLDWFVEHFICDHLFQKRRCDIILEINDMIIFIHYPYLHIDDPSLWTAGSCIGYIDYLIFISFVQ